MPPPLRPFPFPLPSPFTPTPGTGGPLVNLPSPIQNILGIHTPSPKIGGPLVNVSLPPGLLGKPLVNQPPPKIDGPLINVPDQGILDKSLALAKGQGGENPTDPNQKAAPEGKESRLQRIIREKKAGLFPKKPAYNVDALKQDVRVINQLDPKTFTTNPEVLASIKQAGYNSLDEVRADLAKLGDLPMDVRAKLAQVPADIKSLLAEPDKPVARPGALTRLPSGNMPNLHLLDDPSLQGVVSYRGTGQDNGILISRKAPLVQDEDGRQVRQGIDRVEPIGLLPYMYEDSIPSVEHTEWAAKNKERLASGDLTREAALLSSLYPTIASINRGAVPWTAIFGKKKDERGKWVPQDNPLINPGRIAENQTDIIGRIGPSEAVGDNIRGGEVRPESGLTLFGSDTTNPKQMKLLAGLASEDNFSTPEARDRAVAEGIADLYDNFHRLGNMPNQDEEKFNGDPRTGGNAAGRPYPHSMKETMPKAFDLLHAWATGDQSQGFGQGREADNALLYQSLVSLGIPGIKGTKIPFFLGNLLNPDFGTLDKRMLHDVFGLHPDMMDSLSHDERMHLLGKIFKAVRNAGSNYEAQWRAWQYLTGEKTDYRSLRNATEKVNDFIKRAKIEGQKRGVPYGDILDELSANEPREDWVPSTDNRIVQTQVGISNDAIQGMEGATGKALVKRMPEIAQEMRRAGVNLVGARPGEDPLQQLERLLTTGEGGWGDPESGQHFNERDLHLLVQGTRSANEYLAAMLAKIWGQRGVMAAHLDDQGPHRLMSWNVPNLTREYAKELGDKLKDVIPEGWHFAFPEEGSSLHVARADEDQNVYNRVQRDLHDLLVDMGHNPSNPTVRKAEVKFLGPDYSQTLYGGPYGYHPPERAGH